VTYGEFLRFCRLTAKFDRKTDFARKLGMKDSDHYIGAENDKPNKKPSLDLLERAAQEAGLQFTDFLQQPQKRKLSREHESLHTKLQELLDAGGDEAVWIEGNLIIFHKAKFRRR